MVKATVGSTSKLNNLNEFLEAKNKIEPLQENIIHEIQELQYCWSDELDIHAEPWTM